jgi:hypothetical protein
MKANFKVWDLRGNVLLNREIETNFKSDRVTAKAMVEFCKSVGLTWKLELPNKTSVHDLTGF